MTLPSEVTFGGMRPLHGRLRLPGDKSISHRALMFAALADGCSTITNLATGEDVHATRLAIERCGVDGPYSTTFYASFPFTRSG